MAAALILAFGVHAAPAFAHDGVAHRSAQEAAAHAVASPPPSPALPFPVKITARFDLIDQAGARRTEADFAGAPWLLFFGYARCEAICSVALPRLVETLDLLGAAGAALTPVMITVDPEGDTPASLSETLPRWSPRLVGLTGSPRALAAARAAFQVSARKIMDLPDGTPVFSHGSFIYLMNANGEVATILPPVLGPDRMAKIIAGHL